MIQRALIAIFLMALITYIIRALPITLMKKNISNRYLKTFLDYVPYAVLASLTFPDIFYSTLHFVSALAGTMVAMLLAYFRKSLVIVAVCSILTVYIAELIL